MLAKTPVLPMARRPGGHTKATRHKVSERSVYPGAVCPSRENPFEEPVFPPVESATSRGTAARGVGRKNESVLLGARRREGNEAREGKERAAQRETERREEQKERE